MSVRETGGGRPALLVAATHSGAGKTTVTASLLQALRCRGRVVQPFKVGPDFIDTAYHTEAAGRPAINLDLWMMGTSGVHRSYAAYSSEADISVIESMGGLFDGADGTGTGSAAHVAKLLGVPVVVVADVWGMTRTTGAIVAGLRGFDPELDIAGVILNRFGSSAHTRMVLDSLSDELRQLVLGSIPHDSSLAIPERHLGILTVEENRTSRAERARAYKMAATDINLDRVLAVADRGRRVTPTSTHRREPRGGQALTLAVARDPAFCFYYEENLRALRDAGFDIAYFAPTTDDSLPPGTDAVYVGGGYPESYAAELAANRSLASDLQRHVAAGLPVYAECGGLVYLGRRLTGYDGTTHPMTGILPIDTTMDPEQLTIRYVEARTLLDTPLGPTGTRLRGQEFHQSVVTSDETRGPGLYSLITSDGQRFDAGYVEGSVVASYIHVHFASNPEVPHHLAQAAAAAQGNSRSESGYTL